MTRWLPVRALGCLAWLLVCPVALSAAPKVEVVAPQEPVEVGRAVVIDVTVLVPSWFTKPVYFDPIEGLNLINVQTEKSTYPTSRSINGETWTGVGKEYTLVPMVEGLYQVEIPGLTVHYPDENGKPATERVTLEPVTLRTQVPAAARALDPLIIADNIDIEQTFDMPETVQVGDHIARTITVTVSGTSALFIPSLLTDVDNDALKTYLQSPVVKDDMVGSDLALGGRRSEQQSIRVLAPGQWQLSEITLRYYQNSTEQIVEVSVPGKTLNVARPPLSRWQWAALVVAALVLLALCYALGRYLVTLFHRFWQTEPMQYRRLRWQAHRPSRQFLRALATWQDHWRHVYSVNDALSRQYHALVIQAESRIYLSAATSTSLARALREHRHALKTHSHRRHQQLQPLNP